MFADFVDANATHFITFEESINAILDESEKKYDAEIEKLTKRADEFESDESFGKACKDVAQTTHSEAQWLLEALLNDMRKKYYTISN